MLKTKTKVKAGFVCVLSIAAGVQASSLVANQAAADDTNTTFQVNVVESLSVSVSADSSKEGTGNINTFLRNTVNLKVTSNNATGFTATMYANNTNLTNESDSSFTVPTLSADSTRANFPSNSWGYSLDTNVTMNSKTYNESDAGSDSSYYHALTTSDAPQTVLTGSGATSGSRKIYLGAKADATKAAGAYTGTVVVSVVTGTVNPNNDSPADPTKPVNPAHNSDTTSGNATYDSTNNRTVYYDSSSSTAEVSAGDTTQSYKDPAGVTEHTTSSINTGNSVATGLLVASAVAATSGVLFFVLAKRKKDDDDEDDENVV